MQTITHYYEHLKNVKPFLEKYTNYDPYDDKVHILYVSPRLCSQEYYASILPALELNTTSTHTAIMTSIELYDKDRDFFDTTKQIDTRLLKWADYIVFPTILSDMAYMIQVLRLLYPRLQIVMHLDDNYHKLPTWHSSYKSIASNVQEQLISTISTLDICICQNESLKIQYESALGFFYEQSSCLVTTMPALISRKSFENLNSIEINTDLMTRIGVFSPSEKFLNYLPSLLKILHKKNHKVSFVIFDYKGVKRDYKKVLPIEFYENTSYSNYFEDVYKLQLTIALFSVSEYSAYQSIHSYLEMAVLGVPTIVCKTHPASSIVLEQESGLIISKQNDWELTICKLLEKDDFRKKLIRHSVKTVWKHHSFTRKTLKSITSVFV